MAVSFPSLRSLASDGRAGGVPVGSFLLLGYSFPSLRFLASDGRAGGGPVGSSLTTYPFPSLLFLASGGRAGGGPVGSFIIATHVHATERFLDSMLENALKLPYKHQKTTFVRCGLLVLGP